MECEFPCEEALFQSEHPYSESKFRFSRNLTLYEAFQKLFDTPRESPRQTPDIGHLDLTVFDLFILIHRMESSHPFVWPWLTVQFYSHS